MNPKLSYDQYPRCERDCGACRRHLHTTREGADALRTGQIAAEDLPAGELRITDPRPEAYDCRRCQGCGEDLATSIYNHAMQNKEVTDDFGDTVAEATDDAYHCCEADFNFYRHGTTDPPGLHEIGTETE